MKKLSVCFLLAVCSTLAAADIIRRETILPGTRENIPAAKNENITLPASAATAGTFTMWLRPDGWDNSDPAWHFFVTAGSPSGPGVWLYRFANGNTRLLWILDQNKAGDITVPINFASGQWIHLAFTWEVKNHRTYLALFVNGRKVKSRSDALELGDKFPVNWRVGDLPNWNPKSRFSSTLGRTVIYDRVLTDAEIAALAAQKYDENGALIVTNHNFLPCSTNTISGKAAANAAYLEVTFADEVGNITRKEVPGIFHRGYFRTNLTIPDNCVEIRLTVKDANGKPVFWQPEEIVYANFLPPYLPGYWQAGWIWAGAPREGNATRFFRRKFVVKLDELSLAAFQWAADDRSEVFINGVSIGNSRGWATPVVRDDLLALLKDGENIITVQAGNIGGSAGFFGELSLVDKNGNVVKIGTDESWKGADREFTGWQRVDFDDSAWVPAYVLMRPPQLPYGMAPYRNFATVPVLAMHGEKSTVNATMGQKVKLEYRFDAPDSDGELEVYVKLIRNGRELYRQRAAELRNSNELIISAEIFIPQSVTAESYTVALESRNCNFGQDNITGTLNILPGNTATEPTVAVVRQVNGIPTIFINDRPVPSMLYRNRINNRDDTLGNGFITAFDRAGIRLTEMNISLAQIWKNDGSLNTDAVDLYLRSAIYYAPNSKFILFINTDAPAWYVHQNQQDQFITDKGRSNNRISYASEKYRQDAAEIIRKLITYLKTCNEYHFLAGFGLDGGEDGQFMQWTGRNLDYIGDYSQPMKDRFHAELRRRYNDIAALNAAWQSNYADFADIPIPSVGRRMGQDGKIFLDPVKDADIIIFNRVYSDVAADFILNCARVIKEETGNERMVSVYYGKFFTIAGMIEYAEFSIAQMLNSPYIDMMIAVEYSERDGGKPHSISAVSESYRLHNKIFIDEADLRTFLSGSKAWGYAGNAFETVSMIRKMFIFNFVRGMGIHWYDLHGGMFENPAIISAIGRTGQVAAAGQSAPLQSKAEIAVIVDENSFLATTPQIKALASASIRHQQNGQFARIGTPFDMYFAEDMLHQDFPEYKMYVFLNLWAPSPEVIQAVENLKRDGKILVFCGNAGMISNGTSGADNVARFTGISMQQYGPAALSMELEIPGQTATYWTSAGKAQFVIAANDPAAQRFGRLPDLPGVSPFVIKNCGRYTAVHTAVPVLNSEVWRYLARLAGCHIYSGDPDTMCYIGRGMIGIHSGTSGEKVINFPVAATFTDAISGEVYARNTRTLKINMKEKETKIIIVKEN